MKHILILLAFASVAMAQPKVTAALDVAEYTSNIAQGSIFAVFGTGLSPAGYVGATAPTFPATLNNVKVSLTAVTGGAVVNSLMVYTYNVDGVNQLAALLPSGTPVGAYDLRVDNAGTVSAPLRTNVVARKPGIVTANSSGVGEAQATIGGKMVLQRTSNLGKIGAFDTRPVHPGERVDLWGTGLGPDLASDTGGSSGDQTAAGQIRVFVNGAEVTPTYAGRSQGSPGLDQIAFTLPTDAALNCTVDIQVSAGGVLSNVVTLATSPDTSEACPTTVSMRFNEVESNGGTPGDWVELYNPGPGSVDLAGYGFKDNDDTHAAYVLPSTVVPAGGYLVLDEAAFGFGLGAAESVRLFRPDGTLADSYSWTAHATTTYGRCPSSSGAFTNTNSSTKGSLNDCGGSPVKINEVESDGGTPGDWVELFNPSATAASVAGFVFKDNDDTHSYVIPAGTTIPAGGYLVLDEATFGFGLGGADSARLFDSAAGVVDAYTWTAHATTTYGRCPDGTGALATSAASTKGAANSCIVAMPQVKINEVESNGGTPGDWVELYNPGTSAVSLAGFVFKDGDDTHSFTLPANASIAAGGYYLLEEAAFGFGLGTPDSARLFDTKGALVDSYSWTPHATTTYGLCPNGSGTFTTTTSSTKGAANDCGSPVKINEVESDSGTPGDWVELYNPGTAAANIAGFVFKDSDDTHSYVLPAGTTVPAGGYLVLEEAAFGFGLGSGDSARLYDSTAKLIDSYAWTAHAASTYGRCADGSGDFATTTAPTRGSANACPGAVTFLTWPGGSTVQTADNAGVFNGNLSGLMYEGNGSATGTIWAARNGPGTLFRLVFNGTVWVPDTANAWGSGKLLRYPNGTGDVDAEGVTFAATGSAGGMYVATERDNGNNAVSRLSVLRFDPAASGATLTATHEWNLTADLPVVGANLGLEAITWIPDTFLVSKGFFDETKNHVYNSAEYPNHGTGLFLVGVEANGNIYAYALDQAGTAFNRIATISSGFTGVMDLQFDRELNDLWAVCDDTCQGRASVLRINGTGKFAVAKTFDRPSGMPNLNNEGFTFAPLALCSASTRPAYWSDDAETGGHAIRSGTIGCTAP